jgi:hypothetical protein
MSEVGSEIRASVAQLLARGDLLREMSCSALWYREGRSAAQRRAEEPRCVLADSLATESRRAVVRQRVAEGPHATGQRYWVGQRCEEAQQCAVG